MEIVLLFVFNRGVTSLSFLQIHSNNKKKLRWFLPNGESYRGVEGKIVLFKSKQNEII